VLSAKNAKWVFALVLLVVVATVEAAPSIGGSDAKVVALTVSPSSYTEISTIDKAEPLIISNNSALAHIAADLLKPPAEPASRTALPSEIKPLPAVPAALFMALTGFLCVTLVRDRKVWLAVLTTILWASQVGITALPQKCGVCIAHHINKRWTIPILPYLGKQASRLLSEFKGTEYIGLLRYLEGIPAAGNTKCKIRTTEQSPQLAIANSLHYIIPANICLAKIVRPWRICFLPAFIIDSIPRGPPIPLTC
jgi:hypothetical protein